MNGRKIDVAIVGGGLAGGLAALALHRARPDLALALFEAGDAPGGNHRWSWFASDLSAEADQLLSDFRITRWDQGYDVRFPGHSRQLATGYRSLASADFAAGLNRLLPADTIHLRAPVRQLHARGLVLESGDAVAARTVIDCRGFRPSAQITGGWQVFMGRHMRTSRPHGVERPVIMDARVEQLGGYRFIYVLPLGADELLIEDTYYADSPALDRRVLGARIEAWCAAQGWAGEILGNETGVLPVLTGGNFAAWQAQGQIDGVARAGTGAGLMHSLTSYSLPCAAETALAIAAEADLPGDQLAAMLHARAARHWRAMGFYRRLGTMLFGAGRPEQRTRVFERFYTMPEGLIARFYAGRSTMADRLRLLIGKPPVPVFKALRALLASGQPMGETGRT